MNIPGFPRSPTRGLSTVGHTVFLQSSVRLNDPARLCRMPVEADDSDGPVNKSLAEIRS